MCESVDLTVESTAQKILNFIIFLNFRELRQVIDDLAVNPKCRSIVLSGNGKSFCAGIDLKLGATVLFIIKCI